MWHIFQRLDNGNYRLAMRHLHKTKKTNSPSSHKHFYFSRMHLPQVWLVSLLHLYEYCMHRIHSLFGYATFPYEQKLGNIRRECKSFTHLNMDKLPEPPSHIQISMFSFQHLRNRVQCMNLISPTQDFRW